jgi:glycosyltransferase involved in cell wall biosynthesis
VNVLFLTHRADTPSTRYRVTPFADRLRAAGHDAAVREYSSSPVRLMRLLKAAKAADAVVLQKRLPPPWITRAIRKRSRKFIYDFDDAVYIRREGAGGSATRDRRFDAVLAAADAVVAGNSHLADVARRRGAKDVRVIPTVLDPAKYEAAARGPRGGVVAGWIGAGGNLPYLEAILPGLRELPVRVRVVCNRFPEGVEKVAWSEEGEAAAVAGMDIGLAPMPDDEWTRGKCGTRILQYHAAGVPVVADDVGAHRDLVGKGGYLVRSPEEWARRVRELAADPALRSRLGEEGRRRLREAFTPDAVFPHWLELLTSPRSSGGPAQMGRRYGDPIL